MQPSELGLEETLLSKDSRNKFFYLPGSREGSKHSGGREKSPLANPLSRGARGQRSHGVSAGGRGAGAMLPAQDEKEKCPHSNKTLLSTEETKRTP